MTDLMKAVTEWLDEVSVEWTADADESVKFALDWGSSQYECTFGMNEQTLTMCIAWRGTFAPDVERAASVLTELSVLARRAQVWINPRTGEVIYRTGVHFETDRQIECANVTRVLRLTLDIFNVMILATKQVVGGSMTQRQALETFAATLPTLFDANEKADETSHDEWSEVELADDEDHPRDRLAPYWDDDDDPSLD